LMPKADSEGNGYVDVYDRNSGRGRIR
jgi:hypothetical protein